MAKKKKKKKMPEQVQRQKDFLDMIAPAAVKFNTDHFILGSRYHTAMTLKSYSSVEDSERNAIFSEAMERIIKQGYSKIASLENNASGKS